MEAHEVMADPATSYWLKDAYFALQRRDPVDALRDAEVLVQLMTQRLEKLQT